MTKYIHQGVVALLREKGVKPEQLRNADMLVAGDIDEVYNTVCRTNHDPVQDSWRDRVAQNSGNNSSARSAR